MKVSFSISVKKGVKTDKYADWYKNEGMTNYASTENILPFMIRDLKKWIKEIEEKYPGLKNKNSSLDEHF